jgi:hypothetical protein
MRALQEIAAGKDPDAFQQAVDIVSTWGRDDRREGVKLLLQGLAERRIGRRDQANQWIWDLADMTRDVHEEYAVQRWPETKRLLGLLVNSSGGAHARNARRLVHASRKQDRRLSAAILAAAVAHSPEAMEVVRGARTRMARKPSSLSRELLRNFPKGRGRRNRRRKKGAAHHGEQAAPGVERDLAAVLAAQAAEAEAREARAREEERVTHAAGARAKAAGASEAEVLAAISAAAAALAQAVGEAPTGRSRRSRSRRSRRNAAAQAAALLAGGGSSAEADPPAANGTTPEAGEPAVNGARPDAEASGDARDDRGIDGVPAVVTAPPEKPKRASRKKAAVGVDGTVGVVEVPEKPKRAPRKKAAAKVEPAVGVAEVPEKPKRAPRKKAAETPDAKQPESRDDAAVAETPEDKPKRARAKKAAAADAAAEAPSKPKRAPRKKTVDAPPEGEAPEKPKRTPRGKSGAL